MTILLDTGRWAAVQEKKNKTTEKIHGSSEGGLVRQKRMMEADDSLWWPLKKAAERKQRGLSSKKTKKTMKKNLCV